ncbi:MAG: hypothetical protein H0U10_00610 [Chloroflexia bacterium]|nr:hypothetical protein [Chloroflexia bacterium]
MTALAGIGRVVTYMLAAAFATLLLTTVSERRLASYGTVLAVALLAVALGGVNAAIASLLKRLPRGAGCLPFAIIAMAADATLLFGVAVLGTATRLTPWGVVVGAAFATIASGLVFSLWDEPDGVG